MLARSPAFLVYAVTSQHVGCKAGLQYLQIIDCTSLVLVAIGLSAKGQEAKPEAVPPIILYFRAPALSCFLLGLRSDMALPLTTVSLSLREVPWAVLGGELERRLSMIALVPCFHSSEGFL